MPKGSETLEMKILPHGKYELPTNWYQPICPWLQIGRHWLAGNYFFPCGRIFISSTSELLGINIEGLNSVLLGIQIFI